MARMKPFAILLCAALVLATTGCAKINDAGMRLLSSSAPALAVVSGTLLSGRVSLLSDRTGTVSLESPYGLKCMGDLRYTASRSGSINLRCSDGTSVSLAFNALSETSGFANSQEARQPASLAYGLEPAQATAYLIPPSGKRIVSNAEGHLRLE